MRKILSFKILTAMVLSFMLIGFSQAQFTTSISGNVTVGANNDAGANMNFLLSIDGDTTGIPFPAFLPFETDESGNYQITVLMGFDYTISAYDSFSYNPFSADVKVGMGPEVLDIHLDERTDLMPVNGNVSFLAAAVETEIYFVKLPNELDIEDYRNYEPHFNLPGYALTRWASYSTMTDASGNFNAEMLDGNYVVYIPAGDMYLSYWGIATVKGTTTMDPIHLVKKTTIAGTISNADDYDYVTVMSYSVDAKRPAMAVPDSAGNYILYVAPGEYVVRSVGFFDDHMYHVFYDSVYKAEDAEHVTVGDDGVTGIDFTFPEAVVYPFSVSGTITSNQTGNAIEGAHVQFTSYNFYSNLYRTYEGTTDADGNYTVMGNTMLQEDSLVGFAWDTLFFAQFYDGQATFLNADPIVYHANKDITGIDFALDTLDTSSGFAISGTVVDEDGNPVVTGSVTAYTTASNVGVATAMIDTLGNYDFGSIFPNTSTVYLQAWGGYGYVPEIYNDATSWEDADAITIAGADQVIDFELVKTGPARLPLFTIRGLVDLGLGKTANASALEGAVVYVKPVGAKEWTNVDYVANDGSFALGIEKEGDYEVMVSTRENGDQTQVVNSKDGDITMSPTGIAGPKPAIIRSAKLYQAYPNPFNPTTKIQVEMAKTANASLIIYNVIGQKVKTIYNGKLDQGLRSFSWNGTDQAGQSVASGLYFYQLKTANYIDTKAVMFLK